MQCLRSGRRCCNATSSSRRLQCMSFQEPHIQLTVLRSQCLRRKAAHSRTGCFGKCCRERSHHRPGMLPLRSGSRIVTAPWLLRKQERRATLSYRSGVYASRVHRGTECVRSAAKRFCATRSRGAMRQASCRQSIVKATPRDGGATIACAPTTTEAARANCSFLAVQSLQSVWSARWYEACCTERRVLRSGTARASVQQWTDGRQHVAQGSRRGPT